MCEPGDYMCRTPKLAERPQRQSAYACNYFNNTDTVCASCILPFGIYYVKAKW